MEIKKFGANAHEQDILESARCREITQEILNFGVNQSQLLTLIKLLSLELEDRDTMLKIVKIIENEFDSDNEVTPTIEV